MKLVIDIGNTRAKAAVFSSRTMVFVESYNSISLNDIKNIIEKFPTIKNQFFLRYQIITMKISKII